MGKFNPGCGCCQKCLIFEDYLPWAYLDDAAREAAGWSLVDGFWQHPKVLPKDNWQVVANDVSSELGTWELKAANADDPNIVAVEIRGADSGDTIVRLSSIWIESTNSPGLRLTVEDNDFDFTYLDSHVLSPEVSGSWGTIFTTDFDWLTFGTPRLLARPTVCRIVKRHDSIYVELLRHSYASEGLQSTHPIHVDSVVLQSPPVISSPVPLSLEASEESSMAIPLSGEWDERFHLLISPDVKGHEFIPATRRSPLTQNITSRFFVTNVGVHGVEPLDADVSGARSFQLSSSTPLNGVKCANPGFVAAMPPHNGLPLWTASLSGFDDCGVHHRHTTHSQTSWFDAFEYKSSASWTDSIYYRISAIYRPRYGGFFPPGYRLLSDQPSLFHPDAVDLLDFNEVSEWVPDLTLTEKAFPDVEKSYSGPISIRRAHINTTVERSNDDDHVDIVVTVNLIGDAQDSPEVLIQWRPFWFHNLGESFPGPYRIFASDRGIIPITGQYSGAQRLIYRKTIPRWEGEPPSVTITAADLQMTSAGTPGTENVPIYWMNEYYWSGTNGTYILLQNGPWGPWRVWWDETVRTRGVNVAPLMQINLTPQTFRPQAFP